MLDYVLFCLIKAILASENAACCHLRPITLSQLMEPRGNVSSKPKYAQVNLSTIKLVFGGNLETGNSQETEQVPEKYFVIFFPLVLYLKKGLFAVYHF